MTQMSFNPGTALAYARKFSRPRLAGSRAGDQVAEEIRQQLASQGFAVVEQEFQFSNALEWFLAVEILAGMLLILAALLVSGLNRWLTLVPVGLLLILLVGIGPLNRRVQRNSLDPGRGEGDPFWASLCWKIGARFRTRNIVASLAGAGAGTDLPHLYLVAHYDSKSQNMPLAARIGLFVLLTAGSLAFAVLNVLNLFLGSLEGLIAAAGSLVLVSGIPLLLLKTGDASPGAVDNASGLGLVLHLAEVLGAQPEITSSLHLKVLITGAEELGVMGALAYVDQNRAALFRFRDRGGLSVLNFDGIGVAGRLYFAGGGRKRLRPSGPGLHRLLAQSAEELGITVSKFSLPGALFDHLPFADQGFDALTLLGIGRGSWSIHTAGDTPEKLHVRGFQQAGELALRVIEHLSRGTAWR